MSSLGMEGLGVWSVCLLFPTPGLQDGSLVRQYKGSSGIFEVCWSRDGHKLAASFSDNTVSGVTQCGKHLGWRGGGVCGCTCKSIICTRE